MWSMETRGNQCLSRGLLLRCQPRISLHISCQCVSPSLNYSYTFISQSSTASNPMISLIYYVFPIFFYTKKFPPKYLTLVYIFHHYFFKIFVISSRHNSLFIFQCQLLVPIQMIKKITYCTFCRSIKSKELN